LSGYGIKNPGNCEEVCGNAGIYGYMRGNVGKVFEKPLHLYIVKGTKRQKRKDRDSKKPKKEGKENVRQDKQGMQVESMALSLLQWRQES
jgi:hypothetical protein